jgi:hypothetical protein
MRLVWDPFYSDQYSFWTAAKSNPSHLRNGSLWRLIRSTSQFDTAPEPCYNQQSIFQNLYMKASLLHRLYSISSHDSNGPDIPRWSIVLSKHFASLLGLQWDDVEITVGDRAYIIASLSKLVNVLLEPASHTTAEIEQPRADDQAQTTDQDELPLEAAAHTQLESLLEAGILKILASPFSSDFIPLETSERVPDVAGWRDELARTIDKLARRFPDRTSKEHTLYSQLVEYYEGLEENDRRSEIFEVVKNLRDEMVHQSV